MPSTALATAASLLVALASPCCRRLAWCTRSRMRVLRERVSSRRARRGAGGMTLACSRPWRTSSASQSLSVTSVVRPGTVFRCWGVTRRRRHPSSSRWETGHHDTPVLSSATGVTRSSSNHSPSASRSAVMVPNGRVCFCAGPSRPVSTTVTTTVRFCTSIPAQRSYITRSGSLPSDHRLTHRDRRGVWGARPRHVSLACSRPRPSGEAARPRRQSALLDTPKARASTGSHAPVGGRP